MTRPEDREAALTAMRRTAGGRALSRCRKRFAMSARTAPLVGRACACRLCGTRTPYFVAVVEDITDRVQAERALRESERRLTLVQGVAHLGIWDRDLRTNTIATYGDYSRLHGLAPRHSPIPTRSGSHWSILPTAKPSRYTCGRVSNRRTSGTANSAYCGPTAASTGCWRRARSTLMTRAAGRHGGRQSGYH